MKKLLSMLLAAIITVSVMSVAVAAEKDTVILYTNDVHCAIDDYPILAAYRAELIAQGKNVIAVDAGDAIQGEVIGSLTEGEAVVDIMNAVGYDYAAPGNHEFDYGMEVFLDLAQNKAEYEYISSNFHYLPAVSPVFAPYAIEDFGDYQVAFVGISTPETITKSTPEFFKDESNNFIYGFPKYPGIMTNEALYENIQESVDYAIADGADIVVAVGHTGILETSEGWKSTVIIANTDGIDYYIDAHSHETIESATYKNMNNEDVVLTSTGTKFANFGVLTISDDNASFELINPDDVDVETMSDSAKSAYNTVKDKIDSYNEEISYLYEEIGTSEAKLVAYDSDRSWAVRKRETNAGDFVADAYRAVTGADVAIANGGGIRADVEIGSVSRKNLMDVNAFNNDMCVVEVTGQQLIDVLEHGARECPDPIGGFFQVSGVEFEIHAYRETPVVTDQLDNFIEMDETKERRVQNVLIDGEPVDLEKTYTLAGSAYVLTQGGDGLTMLEGARVVQQEGLPCDSEMLIEYLEMLGNTIPAAKYGNPDGDGRIKIIKSNPDASDYDYEISYGETITVPVNSEGKTIVKFTPEESAKYILNAQSDELDTYCELYSSDSIEEILITADDENGIDFSLEYDFEEGITYYFHVKVYDEGEHEFEITLDCGHSFENGTCVICGETCDNTEIGFLGFCLCGEIFLGEDINDGDEFELESESSDDIFWFRFTPEVSGTYSFKSVSENADPDCFMYDAEGEWVTDSYDVNDMDFDLIYYFEAGETYYFDVHEIYAAGIFEVALNRLTHTADDGSVHTDIEFVEGTYSNCTEHGYTGGLYCNECEEFISGHEEKELDEYYHIDDNFDEICDLCGKENIYDEEICSHICHCDHWFWSFIWNVIRFFSKLFGSNPVCECGELHY